MRNTTLLFGILGIHILAFVRIFPQNLFVDEYLHYDQIMRFVFGNFTINPLIFMIPGYHMFLAILGRIFHMESIQFFRVISFLFSILSIIIFYAAVQKIDPKNVRMKILQYAFLPIMVPFYGLIYTDVPSVTLILLMILLIFYRRYFLAGLVGTLSIFLRQNNIMWFVFGNILIFGVENRFVLKQSLTFLMGLVLFVELTVLMQKSGFFFLPTELDPRIITGNVALFLFTLLLLFLPIHIRNIPRVISLLRMHKILFFPLLAGLVIFLPLFRITHPWNQEPFFIRNSVALFFTSGVATKVIFYILVAYSLLSLMTIRFLHRFSFFLSLVSFLFLIFTWLIDPRYFFIPICLFLLFRRSESQKIEMMIVGLFGILSVALFEGTLYRWLFL